MKIIPIKISGDTARILCSIPTDLGNVLNRRLGYNQTVMMIKRDALGDVVYRNGRPVRELSTQLKTKYRYLDREFPAGMIQRATKVLKRRGYRVKVLDTRPKPDLKEADILSRMAELPIELRPYQINAVARGLSKPYMTFHMATGTGKTVTFCALIKILNLKTLLIVDKTDLLQQHYKVLSNFFGKENVGIIQGNKFNADMPINIAMVPTIHARLKNGGSPQYRMRKYLKSVEYLIDDECFSEDTIVDNKKIIDIVAGDLISTPNGKRKVTRVFKNIVKLDHIAKATFSNGKIIYCTIDHEYMTSYGYWKPICEFALGQEVCTNGEKSNDEMHSMRKSLSTNMSWEKSARTLFQKMFIQVENMAREITYRSKKCNTKEKENKSHKMPGMWKIHAEKKKILLFNMYVFMSNIQGRFFQTYEENESRQEKRNNSSYENTESNVKQENNRKDDFCKKEKWHIPYMERRKRRKWENNGATTNTFGSTKLADRTANKYGRAYTIENESILSENKEIPSLLQGRYREPIKKSSNRSRWSESQFQREKRIRYKKRKSTEQVRLVSFEVYKSGSNDESFMGVITDKDKDNGFKEMYDLEVSEEHCYYANGILVHNCHHSRSKTWKQVHRNCKGALSCHSFSGSPWDQSSDNIELESVSGPILFRYVTSDAIEDGYLARPHVTFHRYPNNREEYLGGGMQQVYEDLIMNNPERNTAVAKVAAEIWNKTEHSMLIVVQRIAHGYIIADRLRNLGIPDDEIAYLHGRRGKIVREEGRKEFESGRTRIMIVSHIWNEGINLPFVNVLIKADALGGGADIKDNEGVRNFVQQIGRVLRKPVDPKTKQINIKKEHIVQVHDFLDGQHKYVRNWTSNRVTTCRNERAFVVNMED